MDEEICDRIQRTEDRLNRSKRIGDGVLRALQRAESRLAISKEVLREAHFTVQKTMPAQVDLAVTDEPPVRS